MSTPREIGRSAGIIGGLTFMSRILGFVRDILIANFFGTTMAAEAFVVSFKLPNLFRDLVGEGAMNSAIVPVLSETKALDGEKAFWKLAWTVAIWMGLLLFFITLMGTLFAPWMVQVMAPGFVKDPEKYALTVKLTRFIFPFLFFIGASALLMGILNSLKNFASSAMGPIFLNICMILSLVLAVPEMGVEALIWGVLAGGFLQCVLQISSLIKLKAPMIRASLWHPGVKKIIRLLIPRLWGTAVYQISVFVDTILASFYWIVGDGGQSALYYSSRIFQLPLAIFSVSLAQAALPTLSNHAASKDKEAFKVSLDFTLRQVLFYSIPAAIGLGLLAEPIINILFKRGQFDDYSAAVTSQALFFYALGLVSCGLIKVLVSAFYALQDTKTPVKTATLCMVVNLILNLIFMHPLKIGGLALATSLAATLNAVLLLILLGRRLETLAAKRILQSLWRSVLSAMVMGAAIQLFFLPWIRQSLDSGNGAILALGISIIVSTLLYFILCTLMKSEEAKSVRRLFIKS